MPTFIDESGDTGPTKRGGKPYFRLGAVWVPTLDEAEKLRTAVRHLRRDLGLRANYEFKFAKTHSRPDQRRAFIELALAIQFRFTVCSINKNAAEWNKAAGSDMHWTCATWLAAVLKPVYLHAEKAKCPLREPIAIDDNADGSFLKTIKRAFRGLQSQRKPGSSLIGPVSFHRSGPDEMLQLADMVCGSVGAYVDNDDTNWYPLIAARDLQTVCLP